MKKNIKLKIDQIYKEIQKEDSSEISLMGNEIGSIFFLHQLSKIDNSKEILITLNSKIESTFSKINNINHTTFSSGLSGIGWAYNYLFKHNVLNEDIESFLLQIDEIVENSVDKLFMLNDYDFLHGVIGQSVYLLERNNYKLLSKIINEIDNNAIKNENGYCWISDFIIDDDMNSKKVYNISLSHGNSAIIVFLSKFLEIESEDISSINKAKKILKEAVKFILSCKMNNKDSIFPSICEVKNNGETRSSRLAWCYGDLGIGIALWQAGEILRDDDIKKEAIITCLHSTKRKTKEKTMIIDAGICHGTSGVAHIFNKMYYYTGKEEFKKAANYWIEETLNMATFKDGLAGYKSYQSEIMGGWKNDYGLLEGVAGIGLVLLSHISDEKPTWDRCLLLS
ncbi:MAG: hypothetical protein KFKLKKLM_00710 [Flavobacteriales bacterium]|nr:hypothetical protein [Flavobacteriales bacterium]